MFALPRETNLQSEPENPDSPTVDSPTAGYLIDTPGIREFGIYDIKPEEISHYFVEMRARFNECKFDNYRHLTEPGCAIIRAVETGEIALSRRSEERREGKKC